MYNSLLLPTTKTTSKERRLELISQEYMKQWHIRIIKTHHLNEFIHDYVSNPSRHPLSRADVVDTQTTRVFGFAVDSNGGMEWYHSCRGGRGSPMIARAFLMDLKDVREVIEFKYDLGFLLESFKNS